MHCNTVGIHVFIMVLKLLWTSRCKKNIKNDSQFYKKRGTNVDQVHCQNPWPITKYVINLIVNLPKQLKSHSCMLQELQDIWTFKSLMNLFISWLHPIACGARNFVDHSVVDLKLKNNGSLTWRIDYPTHHMVWSRGVRCWERNIWGFPKLFSNRLICPTGLDPWKKAQIWLVPI